MIDLYSFYLLIIDLHLAKFIYEDKVGIVARKSLWGTHVSFRSCFWRSTSKPLFLDRILQSSLSDLFSNDRSGYRKFHSILRQNLLSFTTGPGWNDYFHCNSCHSRCINVSDIYWTFWHNAMFYFVKLFLVNSYINWFSKFGKKHPILLIILTTVFHDLVSTSRSTPY